MIDTNEIDNDLAALAEHENTLMYEEILQDYKTAMRKLKHNYPVLFDNKLKSLTGKIEVIEKKLPNVTDYLFNDYIRFINQVAVIKEIKSEVL